MQRIANLSPRQLARIAGALYLVNILGGFFAIGLVPGLLFVDGDAAATAHNILANEVLYRLGIVAHIAIDVTAVGLAVIFYDLFKVVNRRLAILVVFFTLVGTAVETAGVVLQYMPLILLNEPHAGALSTGQLQELALVPISLAVASYSINSVFFGFYGFAIGYLVFRSTFLPAFIGPLLIVGAACYMTYGLANLLAPGFAAHLVPYVQLPSLLGEGTFCLWLLIAGVNNQRWERLVGAPRLAGAL